MEMRPRPTTRTSSKTPSIPRLRWPVSENCELQPTRPRSRRDDCRLCHTVLAATNKCLAQSNKSRTGCEATKKRESSVSRYRRREMTKEEQVVGLIFQVTMWAYIAAAAAYVVIG